MRATLRRMSLAPFEVWVGLITVINVASFVQDPSRNPIHVLVTPWDGIWAFTYGIAGVLMLVGIFRENSAHIEAAGLCFLMAGVTVEILVFASFGVTSLNGTWFTIAVLGLLVVSAVVRLRSLVATSRRIGRQDSSRHEP